MARSKKKTKAKPKAKPAKAKPKAKAKAKPKAKAKAKPAKAKAKAKPAKTKPAKTAPASAPVSLTPFALSETSPGHHSLLLTNFDGSSAVFAAHGLEAGGYAWDCVAKHVLATDATHLATRIGFDPEASMFCAYGADREALEELGAKLAALYADHVTLSATIEAIGPEGFVD